MRDYEFKVYPDAASEWRWQLRAPNGRIVADSGEGYARREDAVRAIGAFKAAVVTAPISPTKLVSARTRGTGALRDALAMAVAEQQVRARGRR